jgi:hypothetical protein
MMGHTATLQINSLSTSKSQLSMHYTYEYGDVLTNHLLCPNTYSCSEVPTNDTPIWLRSKSR